eukprot:8243283-Alexandrium_andersonii.AAC.1
MPMRMHVHAASSARARARGHRKHTCANAAAARAVVPICLHHAQSCPYTSARETRTRKQAEMEEPTRLHDRT